MIARVRGMDEREMNEIWSDGSTTSPKSEHMCDMC